MNHVATITSSITSNKAIVDQTTPNMQASNEGNNSPNVALYQRCTRQNAGNMFSFTTFGASQTPSISIANYLTMRKTCHLNG